MPTKIELFPVTDYTGGLNLRANVVQLRPAESPDMLNVDVDPRGGFGMRKAVGVVNPTILASAPQSLWSFATTGGTRQILTNLASGQLMYSTGGNFTNITLAPHTTGGRHRATSHTDINYIQNGVNKAVRWTGAAATELVDPVVGGTWDPSFDSPTTGEMPIAKTICTHFGSVFVANTVENGTAFKNRVRWSHPNKPEAWRSQDLIDVDTGLDGDEITAMLPFAGKLYIFKNSSMHVISGYSPATFQVSEVSRKVGVPSQEAVCASEDTMYMFSWPTGVYAFHGGGGLEWLFERMYPEIQSGQILGNQQGNITLGWINKRLWVNVTRTTGTVNNHTYVFDPSLWGAQIGHRRMLRPLGGWMQYDTSCGPMLAWTPPGQATRWLACSSWYFTVLELEKDADQDDWIGYPTDIASHYTTKWFDMDAPAMFKRWKRPEFIFARAHTSVLSVDVYKDYDPSHSTRTFTITPTAGSASGSNLWGTDWGTMVWGAEADVEGMQIQKGSSLGRGRAYRIKISGPTPSVRWKVAAITFKYQPLRVRA